MTAAPQSGREMILVVEEEAGDQGLVSRALQSAGYQVTLARDGAEALARVAEATPDLMLAPVALPEIDGCALLRRLRADPATAAIAVIMVAGPGADEEVLACLELGADDCLTQPVATAELLLRVRARIDRPLLPRELLRQDPQTGLLCARPFDAEVERELARARRRRPGSRGAGALAYLELDERPECRVPPGARAQNEIARQVAMLLQVGAGPLEIAGREAEGRFGLLLPQQSAGAARQRLEALSYRIAAHSFAAGGERVHLTPVIGHAVLSPRVRRVELRQQALAALTAARGQLQPSRGQNHPALAAHDMAPARGRWISWIAPWKAARTPS